MYFVEKIQAQGAKQRKIPVLKRFWQEFPIGSYVKITLLDQEQLFFVDVVQTQGKLQRKIPVPLKFWREFSVGKAVKISLVKRGKQNDEN